MSILFYRKAFLDTRVVNIVLRYFVLFRFCLSAHYYFSSYWFYHYNYIVCYLLFYSQVDCEAFSNLVWISAIQIKLLYYNFVFLLKKN